MKVLILAAGYAVRLKEITQDNPKPLLEIGGRKIIDRIIDKVTMLDPSAGVTIVTNHKFFERFTVWAAGSPAAARMSVIDDGSVSNETRLGAIRDIEFAIDARRIDDDLLVIAGDNLFEFDLARFRDFAAARPDGASVALHDIGDLAAATRFGVVKVDRAGTIIDFEEKPAQPRSTLISTGVYYFPKAKLRLIREYVARSGKVDAPGHYIQWLSATNPVYGFIFSEAWYDIGDVASYQKANRDYSQKEEG